MATEIEEGVKELKVSDKHPAKDQKRRGNRINKGGGKTEKQEKQKRRGERKEMKGHEEGKERIRDGKEQKDKKERGKKLHKRKPKKPGSDIESPDDEQMWVEVPEGFDVTKRATLAMLLPDEDGQMKLIPIEDRGPSGTDESDVDTISTSSNSEQDRSH